MPRHLRLSLLLLLALVLAACDTTSPGGRADRCPIGPEANTTTIAGSICLYDASYYGDEIYAYRSPTFRGLPDRNESLTPYLTEGELDASGAFTITLPEPPTALETYTTICRAENGDDLRVGPVIHRLFTFYSDTPPPYDHADIAFIGYLRGVNTVEDHETQMYTYSYSSETQRISGHCPGTEGMPPTDVDITLEPGWNLLKVTDRLPTNPGEPDILWTKVESGAVSNLTGAFQPWVAGLPNVPLD